MEIICPSPNSSFSSLWGNSPSLSTCLNGRMDQERWVRGPYQLRKKPSSWRTLCLSRYNFSQSRIPTHFLTPIQWSCWITSYSGERGWHSLSCRLEKHKHAMDKVQQRKSFCKLWQMIKFKFIIYCNLHRFRAPLSHWHSLTAPQRLAREERSWHKVWAPFSHVNAVCLAYHAAAFQVQQQRRRRRLHQPAKHPPPRCGWQWRAI